MTSYVQRLIAEVKSKNAGEPEYHQAVKEVAESLIPVLERHPCYRDAMILERLIDPDRLPPYEPGSSDAVRSESIAS